MTTKTTTKTKTAPKTANKADALSKLIVQLKSGKHEGKSNLAIAKLIEDAITANAEAKVLEILSSPLDDVFSDYI
jgi:hypothetical protein